MMRREWKNMGEQALVMLLPDWSYLGHSTMESILDAMGHTASCCVKAAKHWHV